MEQLFFTGHGQVEWRDIRPPKLAGDKDALVRPVAVATCDLDTAVVHGAAPFPGPFPLGHEGVGEVVRLAATSPRFPPASGLLSRSRSAAEAAPAAAEGSPVAARASRSAPCTAWSRLAGHGAASSATWSAFRGLITCSCHCPRTSTPPRSQASVTTSPMRGVP